jgi:hypothetical protein
MSQIPNDSMVSPASVMRLFLIQTILVAFVACGDSPSSPSGANPDGTNDVFTQKVTQNGLALFGRSDVSSSFMTNVGKAYEAMLQSSSRVDTAMRGSYNSTVSSQYVYQRVGLGSPSNYATMDAMASDPYADNAVDYIWEGGSGSDLIGEVLEHLLHTVTAVAFELTFPAAWGYSDKNTQLYRAMQEAIDAGDYDITSYADIDDAEAYHRILTQEYAYWLILAEWDYFAVTGAVQDGYGSGNEEFKLGTPDAIMTRNPLGHKLYQDYVEKIFSVPDRTLIVSLFP